MKKITVLLLFTALCAAAFAQDANDFTINGNGIITAYNGRDTAIVIPAQIDGSQVTGIGDKAFVSMDITAVTFPQSIKSIGQEAFSNNKLTSLSLPDGVAVGDSAFANNQLTSLAIGGGSSIGNNAFANHRLTNITLGADISFFDFASPALGRGVYYDYYCNERKAGTYNAGANYPSKSNGGYTFVESRYGAVITEYKGSGGNRLIIPRELSGTAVKGIGDGAFREKKISRMQLPDSLVFIGRRAFYRNELTSVTVPNSVTSIGTGAFYGNALTEFNYAGKRLGSIEMIHVPGGSFQMGKDLGSAAAGDVTPVRTVTLTGFYMSKYPVTQEQYWWVMGTNPSYFSGASGDLHENCPVERVTWYDAVEFCNKLSALEGLQQVYTISGRSPAAWYPITNATVTADWGKNGYRLPTEAQWEYAAKGGNPGAAGWVGYTYSGSDNADDAAWFDGSSGSRTREVGQKRPNSLGLYDMSGNVWEWCWDWYGDYSSSAQTNPVGASSGSFRVLRGGSWSSYVHYLRSAYRLINFPNSRAYTLGFRLVRP